MRRHDSLVVRGRIVPKGWAVAIGRFSERLEGYRAATAPGTPMRQTRIEAMLDELAYRETV
jgi:hypothetical protein